MRNYAGFILKLGVIVLIFVFLFSRSIGNDSLNQFLAVEKNWRFLCLGFFASLTAVLLTFLRWGWLNAALGVRLSMKETFRLGFIGYVFNFLPMGIVGGDLVKGILLAKKNPNLKAACAVSVIMDRVIGLYVMFLIGLAAVYGSGFYHNGQKEAVFATHAILWLTVISTVGLVVLLAPASSHDWRGRLFRRIPLAGNLLGRLYGATSLYQNRKRVVFFSSLATFGVHLLFAASLWLTALGLWGRAPSPQSHLVIYPIANIGSMIPLSAGPLEIFLDALYPLFPITDGLPYQLGCGMIVGVAYRLETLVIAAIGGVYYLASRNEIGAALHEIHNEKESVKRSESEQPLESTSPVREENGEGEKP